MFSRNEANALLEIIDMSVRCTDEEKFRQLVLKTQDLVASDFAMCAVSGASLRSSEPHNIVNVSYPPAWLNLYVSRQFDRIDPIIKEHRLNQDLQYWPDTYQKHDGHKGFVLLAEDYGLKTGYSYGLKDAGSNRLSLFSFGGRSIRNSIRTAGIVQRLVPHLHQTLLRIAAKMKETGPASRASLSPREKEVLKWVKAGKTTWDISVILSISERTVKFHIQNILQKVHAVTRSQAVAIGIEQGLMDVE